MKHALNFMNKNSGPVFVFTQAENFNQKVLVDLYQLPTRLWYMHFVDEFTRYSVAVIVRNKSVYHKVFIKH